MLKARLQPVTASEQRIVRRRLVNLDGHLRGSVTEASDVRVLDLSQDGCRITPVGPLIEGTQAWLKLPGIEAIGCSVVWTDATDAGCAFHRRLHDSEVEFARTTQLHVRTRSQAFGHKGSHRPV